MHFLSTKWVFICLPIKLFIKDRCQFFCFLPSSKWGFPGGAVVKNLPANTGDTGDEYSDVGLIPRLKRSPGEGNGNPLQHSCLKTPMDIGAWWVTVHGVAKSRTRLSLHIHTYTHGHTHFSKYLWAEMFKNWTAEELVREQTKMETNPCNHYHPNFSFSIKDLSLIFSHQPKQASRVSAV